MKKIVLHYQEEVIVGYTYFQYFQGDPETALIVEVDDDFQREDWKVLNSQLVPKDPSEISLRKLNVLKKRKLSEINGKRSRLLFESILYNGKNIHMDAEAVKNYHILLNEYNTHFYPETDGVFDTPILIKLKDNHELFEIETSEKLLDFLSTVNNRVKSVYSSSWKYKDLIRNAITEEEVLNFFEEYISENVNRN